MGSPKQRLQLPVNQELLPFSSTGGEDKRRLLILKQQMAANGPKAADTIIAKSRSLNFDFAFHLGVDFAEVAKGPC